MKIIAFFNNKGGVGKTSLVYHLAWMYAEMGLKVVAADLDPQANLSTMFLDTDRLEELLPDGLHPDTILGVIQPILDGTGDIAPPHVEEIADNIGLIVGDLGLSRFEDKLSDAWPRCLDGDVAAFRTVSAFYRAIRLAAEGREAEVALVDVGPNLGALNRAAIIAAQYVVIPLAPDLFSLQGLKNLGPTLRQWRSGWTERMKKRPDDPRLPLPNGEMRPAGYVTLQHAIRLDRPVAAYRKSMDRIPSVYRKFVMDETDGTDAFVGNDPYSLATLKNYRSLMPMAQDARKPIFALKVADGAIGAHGTAAHACYTDFKKLAEAIARQCGIVVPRRWE